jgi:hypothetical protein
LLAARQLGLQEAPVIMACGWSEAQCKAYVLANNKLAENAGWDRVRQRMTPSAGRTATLESILEFMDRERMQ